MGKETGISWTDHTFNPWWGCTKVSAGCDNCYAETFDRRVGGNHWGKGKTRRTFGDKHWREPLAWDAEAAIVGKSALVFCASMADVMDDEAPSSERDRLWRLIDETPHLTWQLLTKRPQRYWRYLPSEFRHKNVWLGTTTEDQDNYDLRMPALWVISNKMKLVRFISYEPALGPVSMRDKGGQTPDWVIFGGESGNGRRPMERKWADDLLAECRQFGVKFFMKQFSARTPDEGKRLIPAELLIRELPSVG